MPLKKLITNNLMTETVMIMTHIQFRYGKIIINENNSVNGL